MTDKLLKMPFVVTCENTATGTRKIMQVSGKLMLEWIYDNCKQGVNTLALLTQKQLRSAQANARYWVAIVTPVAEYLGYTPLELHTYWKLKFIGFQIINVIDPATGEQLEVKIPKSSTKLSPAKFAEFCNNCIYDAQTIMHVPFGFPDQDNFNSSCQAEIDEYTDKYLNNELED
jgi:hypothetical protein